MVGWNSSHQLHPLSFSDCPNLILLLYIQHSQLKMIKNRIVLFSVESNAILSILRSVVLCGWKYAQMKNRLSFSSLSFICSFPSLSVTFTMILISTVFCLIPALISQLFNHFHHLPNPHLCLPPIWKSLTLDSTLSVNPVGGVRDTTEIQQRKNNNTSKEIENSKLYYKWLNQFIK